jgi:Rod binding domain-containing protein
MMPETAPIDFGQTALATAKAQAARASAGVNAAGDRESVRAAALEFESVFLAQMLAPMFDTLDSDSLFGGGPGEEIYRSILVEEYGKSIARAGGIGIADSIERELLKLQEVVDR